MVVLQSTVLTYAFFLAIDSETKQVAQGFGLLGLVGTLIWSTQALARFGATERKRPRATLPPLLDIEPVPKSIAPEDQLCETILPEFIGPA